MRHFDQIFKNALVRLKEDTSSSSLPDPNALVSAFQTLNPEQQKSILNILPQKGTNLSNDDDNHKHFASWIEAMHKNPSGKQESPTTVPQQPQTSNPSTVANPGGNPGVKSSTTGNTSSGGFV